ncbi:MAG: MmcQ/YjbR family DNA-binding protein [Acidimicrobiales bacterium]
MVKSSLSLLERIRAHCLSLPEVNERPSHGAPTFFIRDKRSFVTVWMDGHHDVHFAQLWAACVPDFRAHLIEERPEIFFLPAYVAHRGWIGVRLDLDLQFDELADLVEEAYRLIAPPALVRLLDEDGSS